MQTRWRQLFGKYHNRKSTVALQQWNIASGNHQYMQVLMGKSSNSIVNFPAMMTRGYHGRPTWPQALLWPEGYPPWQTSQSGHWRSYLGGSCLDAPRYPRSIVAYYGTMVSECPSKSKPWMPWSVVRPLHLLSCLAKCCTVQWCATAWQNHSCWSTRLGMVPPVLPAIYSCWWLGDVANDIVLATLYEAYMETSNSIQRYFPRDTMM